MLNTISLVPYSTLKQQQQQQKTTFLQRLCTIPCIKNTCSTPQPRLIIEHVFKSPREHSTYIFRAFKHDTLRLLLQFWEKEEVEMKGVW